MACSQKRHLQDCSKRTGKDAPMPAPQPEALSTSTKQALADRNIALPMRRWPIGLQYLNTYTSDELSTSPKASGGQYREPTLNQNHDQADRNMVCIYERFIDGICSAICDAIDTWMHTASIVTVVSTDTIGTVLPEATIGPCLKPLILATAPSTTVQEKKYSNAIATAVSENWRLWHTGLSGILTFPSSGLPGPNIPTPLMTFTSKGEKNLAPKILAEKMSKHLNDVSASHANELFDCVSEAFYTHFQIFKAKTLITGVFMTPPITSPYEEVNLDDPEKTKEEALFTAAEIESATAEVEGLGPVAKPRPLHSGIVIPTPGNFV
jgi:hypothetical protein